MTLIKLFTCLALSLACSPLKEYNLNLKEKDESSSYLNRGLQTLKSSYRLSRFKYYTNLVKTSRNIKTRDYSAYSLRTPLEIQKKSSTINSINQDFKTEHTLQSTLWQQISAEYKALCYQTYNLATERLKNHPDLRSNKKMAIVSDLDETVLNNNLFNAYLLTLNRPPKIEDWQKWVKKNNAATIPGSLEFFKYAHSLGIEIFYLSDRHNDLKSETIRNLKDLGYPSTDEKHISLKVKYQHKAKRVKKIEREYEVLLYLGDDLRDFSDTFYEMNNIEKHKKIEENPHIFGSKYIIFPNPIHGSWERNDIFNGKMLSMSEEEKALVRRRLLKIAKL